MPFLCEPEAYPSHFAPFQNVPVSCERSRKVKSEFELFMSLIGINKVKLHSHCSVLVSIRFC